MEAEQILIEPLITEKSVNGRAESRYVFKVHPKATKIAVKMAVAKVFKVKVLAVNTCHVRAKLRMAGKNMGRTTGWKKAYVTLAAGQKITELET